MARSPEPADSFDLDRFVQAQSGIFESACRELQSGLKTSHWMWFVFPQMRGLGTSGMALRFGISGMDEARAYLAHPVLGPRLEHVTRLVLAAGVRTAHEIFGTPDDLKLRSAMTLFARAAATADSPFAAVLERYFDGAEDDATLRLLGLARAD